MMKWYVGSRADVEELQASIVEGMRRDFGTAATQYGEVVQSTDPDVCAIAIDIEDARNPARYLTEANNATLIDELPADLFPRPEGGEVVK